MDINCDCGVCAMLRTARTSWREPQPASQIADAPMLTRLANFVNPPVNTILQSADSVLERIWCGD